MSCGIPGSSSCSAARNLPSWRTSQLERHKRRLDAYQELAKAAMTDGMRLALEAGIGHEREYVRFWTSLRGP